MMKIGEVILLFLTCFIFIITRPLISKRMPAEQRQEEVAEKILHETSVRVVFRASTIEEDPVADIIWLNRAAEIAIDNGTPYFNVTSQRIYKRFVENVGANLSIVEGTIELVADSMKSEYDANEIISVNVNQLSE